MFNNRRFSWSEFGAPMSILLATIGVAKADETDVTLWIGWNVLAPIQQKTRPR